MTDTIIAALISAAVAIVVNLLNSNRNHQKLMNDLEKRDALQLYRIEQLEKKQDLHNEVITRTFHLEEKQSVLEEKISVANHRIEDLEKEANRHE